MKLLLTMAIALCAQLPVINSAPAQTWEPLQTPTNSWQTVALSADGSKLAALENSDADVIWISTNAGVTWTSNAVPGVSDSGRLEAPAWSATGDKLAAVALFGNAVFTSTNYGATWVSNSVPAEPWFRIASSADGNRLVILGGGLSGVGPIYFSADAGQTWTQANAPVTNWVAVAASANGSNWVAATESQSPPGGTIYTSTNGGMDWTLATGAPNQQWVSVAASADGTKLVAAVGLGPVYTSTNSGVSWISNSVPIASWLSVASSADGQTLAVVSAFNGFIYTSTNAGATWQSNNVPAMSWSGIASSADGGVLVAAGLTSFGSSTGNIYTLQTVRDPQLNIVPVGSEAVLSWGLPSTNFVLEQEMDLATTNWVVITNTPVLDFDSLQNEMILSRTNQAGFYRLATP